MTRIHIDLSGVPETLLIPLYCRAVESQRPDALIKDERAVALMNRIDYDFSGIGFSAADMLFTVMRVREFDRRTQAFLAAHPDGTVVSIGCGLDTRFDRVAERNGTVAWYDLDLPEVIALRRQLLAETPRCRFIGCSVLDFAWMDLVGGDTKRPFLFLAEGVFPYFGEAEVKQVVLALQERFPGAELVFDAMTPFMAWLNGLHPPIRKLHTNLWGIKRSQGLEAWSPGVRLLDEWFYFDRPEPRLGRTRLLRFVPLLNKGSSIVHYRLDPRSFQ
ncbi:MAG: class I SAM-dependent methyltransferase [Chloroflexi bacterium]|nr:class I SAM-dependent methyltransferase [Chloroflexota bacterium]MBU1747776.1 class I SAM-dependent methyltransferase [Chloroflexota bacterium]MBU1880358.1 class I SAM-dependent methyltransferase [Chloroflexota bacterium]